MLKDYTLTDEDENILDELDELCGVVQNKEILLENFWFIKNEKGFGNGRYARNLFEKIKFEQADRIIKNNSKNVNNIRKIDIYNSTTLINTEKKPKTIGLCKYLHKLQQLLIKKQLLFLLYNCLNGNFC